MGLTSSKNQIVYEESYPKPDESVEFIETIINVRGSERNKYSWTLKNSEIKAVIVLVHGLHEHSQRHAELALAFAKRGFAVLSLDAVGHGPLFQSSRDRALIVDFNIVVQDFVSFVHQVKSEFVNKKIFLYAHSMGTLVTMLALKELNPLIHAVIFSSVSDLFIS